MPRVRPISILLLVACVTAACVCRRFVYLAWYPVCMSAALATAFGLSLFRAKTLCEELAERIPPHILPDGASAYCRRYTLFWTLWLTVNGLVATATIHAPGPVWHLTRAGLDVPMAWVAWNCCLSYLATALILLVEWFVRRRRFARIFHTSGSTSTPKKIVKAFDTLAREVAWHRRILDRELDLTRVRPVFLATIEPEHMYGILWRTLLPRVAGCEVDPEVIFTPEALLAKMQAAPRVFLVTTPSFLERFCAYADQYEVPRNCVEIVTSGALLTAGVSAAARRVFGIAPREIFGSTETGGVAWRRQGGEADSVYDWQVFDPVRVQADAQGRLVVRSPFSCARVFTMGDGVELAPDGRRFKLLGRVDRLVKINEQRVSLPEMEAKVAALPEVRACALCPYEGAHGTALGAVMVLDDGFAPELGKRALARALRAKLLPLFVKGTVPRKYRFVHELPRNAQGKVRVAALRQILAEEPLEPRVLHAVRTAETWSADFAFDPEAFYFQGHFPGAPVLPGVVQIGLAQRFAESFAGNPLRVRTVKKLKFMQVITPESKIGFQLRRVSARAFDFTYTRDGSLCTSGTLETEA